MRQEQPGPDAAWIGCKAQGVATVGFRDPGATVIGEKIREILLSPAHEAMTTPAEVLLYMAARVQLWAEKIAPALKEGKCVVAGSLAFEHLCLSRAMPEVSASSG